MLEMQGCPPPHPPFRDGKKHSRLAIYQYTNFWLRYTFRFTAPLPRSRTRGVARHVPIPPAVCCRSRLWCKARLRGAAKAAVRCLERGLSGILPIFRSRGLEGLDRAGRGCASLRPVAAAATAQHAAPLPRRRCPQDGSPRPLAAASPRRGQVLVPPDRCHRRQRFAVGPTPSAGGLLAEHRPL